MHSLPGLDLRPTADKLRETLFNVLSAGDPRCLESTVWIDLFAGTGAVGIEALSRGAGMVYFVESATPAAQLIKRNLDSLNITDGFRILQHDAAKALRTLKSQTSVDFVYLDPPYRLEPVYAETLQALADSRLLTSKTIVIAEHFRKFDPGTGSGDLQRYRTLSQGDAVLSFYKLQEVTS